MQTAPAKPPRPAWGSGPGARAQAGSSRGSVDRASGGRSSSGRGGGRSSGSGSTTPRGGTTTPRGLGGGPLIKGSTAEKAAAAKAAAEKAAAEKAAIEKAAEEAAAEKAAAEKAAAEKAAAEKAAVEKAAAEKAAAEKAASDLGGLPGRLVRGPPPFSMVYEADQRYTVYNDWDGVGSDGAVKKNYTYVEVVLAPSGTAGFKMEDGVHGARATGYEFRGSLDYRVVEGSMCFYVDTIELAPAESWQVLRGPGGWQADRHTASRWLPDERSPAELFEDAWKGKRESQTCGDSAVKLNDRVWPAAALVMASQYDSNGHLIARTKEPAVAIDRIQFRPIQSSDVDGLPGRLVRGPPPLSTVYETAHRYEEKMDFDGETSGWGRISPEYRDYTYWTVVLSPSGTASFEMEDGTYCAKASGYEFHGTMAYRVVEGSVCFYTDTIELAPAESWQVLRGPGGSRYEDYAAALAHWSGGNGYIPDEICTSPAELFEEVWNGHRQSHKCGSGPAIKKHLWPVEALLGIREAVEKAGEDAAAGAAAVDISDGEAPTMTAEELAAKDAVDLQKKQEDAVREAADLKEREAARAAKIREQTTNASREFREFWDRSKTAATKKKKNMK